MPDTPATLIDLLNLAAERHPRDRALLMRHDLRTASWTYGELRQRVICLANHFATVLALQPGDRVLICAPNSPMTAAAHLGALQAGLDVVPLDVGSTPDFIRKVAEKTDARLLLGGPGTPRVDGIDHTDLLRIAATGSPSWAGNMPAAGDIAEIVFTSGTTGDPKGTVLSHANIVANVRAASAIVPRTVPLHLLSILPLSACSRQHVTVPMLGGGSVHYASSLQPARLLQEMMRVRPTGMVVVPRFLQMMLQAIEQKVRERDQWAHWERRHRIAAALPIGLRRHLFRKLHRQLGGRLTFFLCGGASLPEDVALMWENMGLRIIEGYGSTECSPVIASNTYDDRRPGAIGRPLAGVEVKLSDEGELWVRGANVSRGYWRDPERTAASFTPDGWFRTGDIAEKSDDGVYRITARLNDRIVLPSGQKVYPADIEEQLRKAGGVADCVVVALPDAHGRDHVHAILRITGDRDPEATALTAIREANGQLGSHQHILGHTIWTRGEFPLTSLGKVKRNEIRSLLIEAHARPGAVAPPASAPSRTIDPAEQLRGLVKGVMRSPDRTITDDSDLGNDLGLDSLGRVELASAIETHLGVPLDETQLAAVRTFADLRALIASGTRPSAPEAFASWPLAKAAIALRAALQSALLFPLHTAYCRPFTVKGAARLEEIDGPVMLIANHTSHVDTVSILRALPPALRRKTAVAAAADYFYRSRLGGAFSSLLLNTFAFSRSGNIRASLERCGELMDGGWSILIYPEGTRSPDGRLLPFKSGIGLLARGLHVSVVPIAVSGGHEILPKGAGLPRRGPAAVEFGSPVKLDADSGADQIVLSLHDAVAALISKEQRRDL